MAYIGTDIGGGTHTEGVLLTQESDMRSASEFEHTSIGAPALINTEYFIGGHVHLDADAVCDAVRGYVVSAHDMSVQQFVAHASAALLVAQQVPCVRCAADHIDIDAFDKRFGAQREQARGVDSDVEQKRYYGKNTAQRARRVEFTALNRTGMRVSNVAGSDVQSADALMQWMRYQ